MTVSRIEGVRAGRLDRHDDGRGTFREAWRASWYPELAFVQANVSTSDAGVLRGLHLHRRQVDHWVLLEGRAAIGLVDVRPVLGGTGDAIGELREATADDWLTIPIGVGHGFLALEPLTMLYLVSGEYDGSDELGFAWDDPVAGLRWPSVPGTPDGRPTLSDRDRTAPTLAELVEKLQA